MLLNAVDLRAARARGAWLGVSWLLALGLGEAIYSTSRAHWPAVVKAFGRHDILLALAAMQTANIGQELVWNAVMAVVMWLRIPFLDQYRVNPKPWPWASKDASVAARFQAVVRTTFWRALVVNNLLLAAPLLALVHYLHNDVLGQNILSADPARFPTRTTLVWQLAVAMVVEDTMFYWGHRALHTWPALYQRVHKIHHEYAHPVVASSEHAHPVEFLLGNLLPVLTPALALDMHLWTAFFWVLVRIFVSAEEHCGYAFPWSPVRLLPFQASVEGHDFHHSHNVGVYGSQFTWWDRVMGTDRQFLTWRAARLDAQEAAASGTTKKPKAA